MLRNEEKEEVLIANPANSPDPFERFLHSTYYEDLRKQGYEQIFLLPLNDLGKDEENAVKKNKLLELKQKIKNHLDSLPVTGTVKANRVNLATSWLFLRKENKIYYVRYMHIFNGNTPAPTPFDQTVPSIYAHVAKKFPINDSYFINTRFLAPNRAEIEKEDLARPVKTVAPPSGHPGLFAGEDEPVAICLGAGEGYFSDQQAAMVNNKTGSLHQNFKFLSDEEQTLLADEIFGKIYRKDVVGRPDGEFYPVLHEKGVCEIDLAHKLQRHGYIDDFYNYKRPGTPMPSKNKATLFATSATTASPVSSDLAPEAENSSSVSTATIAPIGNDLVIEQAAEAPKLS